MLVTMATGTAEMMRIVRFTAVFWERKASATARVTSDINERSPLQASATSSTVCGNMMILPSLTTGMLRILSTVTEALVTSSFKGKAMASYTMYGRGTIKMRNAIARDDKRRTAQPNQ